MTQLQQRRKSLFHRHGETVGGDHHRLFVIVAADPGRAARARRQAIAFKEDHQQERQQRAGDKQQRDHRLRHHARHLGLQREGAAHQRQQPRRGDAANEAEDRRHDHAQGHQPGGAGGVFRLFAPRRAEEGDTIDFGHTHHRQRAGDRQANRQQRPQQTANKQVTGAHFEEGLVDDPLAGEAVQRRQGRHRHQPHQHGEGDQRHFFTDAAELFDIAMAGAEPHRPGAEEQRSFEQAMVDQVIHAADEAQHHQRAVAGGHAGDEGAQPEQDDADILQGVIGQQALNVMLHQRIQPADEGGDHPQHQQHHAPPQRRHAAGQRNG